MEALRTINREDGITVLCNLHSLDMARAYCDRIVGMARGRIVFDGPPAALTSAAVQEVYGLDAEDAEPRTPELPTLARPAAGAPPRRLAGSVGSVTPIVTSHPREPLEKVN
jgi:phosphonate transport system ATP-binding protein